MQSAGRASIWKSWGHMEIQLLFLSCLENLKQIIYLYDVYIIDRFCLSSVLMPLLFLQYKGINVLIS